jgi:ApaG protein
LTKDWLAKVAAQEKDMGPTNFSTTTRGVKISVWPRLNLDQTKPEAAIYLYNYTIKIENLSAQTVQLMSRHWIITDGFNNTEHVVGDGVVGKQPILQPGDHFVYTSSCPLRTPTGRMRGTYHMVDGGNQAFEAEISEFSFSHQSLVN